MLGSGLTHLSSTGSTTEPSVILNRRELTKHSHCVKRVTKRTSSTPGGKPLGQGRGPGFLPRRQLAALCRLPRPAGNRSGLTRGGVPRKFPTHTM